MSTTTNQQRALVQKGVQRLNDRIAIGRPKRRNRAAYIQAAQVDMAYAQALLEAINGGVTLADEPLAAMQSKPAASA